MLKKNLSPFFILVIGSVIILSWIFVVVPELKNNISNFEIYSERIGSDRIVTVIGEELPEPIKTRDVWKQEVFSKDGNNLEIHSTITTSNLLTDEIIFESKSIFVIDRKTRTHIEDPEKFFMFPNNVEKKNYEFIHPLIYFPTEFVFEKEDKLNNLDTYVFSCNLLEDDISYAYTQFSKKILSDSTCRVWVEPITGTEVWFEKTWHDYHLEQNQLFSIDKGFSKTSDFTKNIVIKSVTDKKNLFFFYDFVIPIFIILISVGCFGIILIRNKFQEKKSIVLLELKEARAKKTEEVLYEIIPNSVVTFDKNNKFENCNQKFLDESGFSKDELIGKYAFDFVIESEQKSSKLLLQRIARGESILNLDLHVKRKNGGIFHSLWNNMPMNDENNEYIGFASIGIDLTEIDQLRDDLLEKEKLSSSLELEQTKQKRTQDVFYDEIPNYMATLDKNFDIVGVNQKIADMFGYSKDEILGKSGFSFIIDEDQEKIKKALESLKIGITYEIPLHMKKKDGSILHILWNSVIIYDENKKYNGHYSIGLDLTEIDELKNKLIKNERFVAIGELSSRIAHDIKNPLTALQNSVKIIEIKTGGNNELINKEIQRMNKAIKRIVHQVDQVLNFVKITPFNVKKNQLLEILNSSLESITITKNITLIIPKNDYTIVCDEMKLGVVFYNLILNAVQAIDSDNGTITIRISEEQNNIKLEFENSGLGIDEENFEKIFEPLFTTKMEGTGLGLSSCKTIIQEHRGTISVSSNPVIFTILLPKTQQVLTN